MQNARHEVCVTYLLLLVKKKLGKYYYKQVADVWGVIDKIPENRTKDICSKLWQTIFSECIMEKATSMCRKAVLAKKIQFKFSIPHSTCHEMSPVDEKAYYNWCYLILNVMEEMFVDLK